MRPLSNARPVASALLLPPLMALSACGGGTDKAAADLDHIDSWDTTKLAQALDCTEHKDSNLGAVGQLGVDKASSCTTKQGDDLLLYHFAQDGDLNSYWGDCSTSTTTWCSSKGHWVVTSNSGAVNQDVAQVLKANVAEHASTNSPASTAPSSNAPSSGAPRTSPTATSSGTWDCGPSSELSQAEWTEHCQGTDNSTLQPSATPTGKITGYEGVSSNMTDIVVNTGEATDTFSTKIRSYAKATGIGTVHIYPVTVDNRQGTSKECYTNTVLVTTNGTQIKDLTTDNDLYSWNKNQDDPSLSSQAVNLANTYQDKNCALPGAKTTTYAIFAKPIPTGARMFLTTDSSTSFEAYPLQG